jgi:hypothetical protein
MKRQYLAHVIRTMEERLRMMPGNEMFRIVCSPVDESSKQLGLAGAHYYKGRYFTIFYHCLSSASLESPHRHHVQYRLPV